MVNIIVSGVSRAVPTASPTALDGGVFESSGLLYQQQQFEFLVNGMT